MPVLRITRLVVALAALCAAGMLPTLAHAQSCPWFQQIKFADGAVGCTTDFAVFKDASVAVAGRPLLTDLANYNMNYVAVSSDLATCPAAAVRAFAGMRPEPWGPAGRRAVVEACEAKAKAINPSCSCVAVMMNGASELTRKQFTLLYGDARQIAAVMAAEGVAVSEAAATAAASAHSPAAVAAARPAAASAPAPVTSASAAQAPATQAAAASPGATPQVAAAPTAAATARPVAPDPQAERMMAELAAARAMLDQMRKQQEELLKTTQTAISQAAQQAEEARRAQAQAAQQTAAAQAALQAAHTARTQAAAPAAPARPPEPSYPRMTARALIIGNSGYQHFGALPNPRRDATAMAERLRGLGIEADVVIDADRDTLIKALNDFEAKARRVDVNILFYAGHGVQVEGINYMVPVNMRADGITAGYIRLAAIPLGAILDYMPAKTRLVFLDACRDNPAARSLVATRSASSVGLAPVQTVSGTLISYATRDGATAEDGTGQNSPYTTALLRHIGDPDDIAIVLRRVRTAVMQATGGKQEPWDYGSLTGDAVVLGRMAR